MVAISGPYRTYSSNCIPGSDMISSKSLTSYISELLTSSLTTIKELIINLCNKIYENRRITYFVSVKILSMS